MQLAVLCVLSCFGSLQAARVAESNGTSPVERVVHLLESLQAKIEHDGKEGELMYNKFACWCEKTSTRKAEAIKQAQEDLRSLGQQILKLKGKVATLASEIEQLAADIKQNEEEQAEATAIREKENAEYVASTSEMKQVLAALEKAIIVLAKGVRDDEKNGEGAFIQTGVASAAVKAVVEVLPGSVSLKADQMSLLSEFMSMSSAAKYAPQSMTIQGILRDMYDTFSTDLESSTVKEATGNTHFEALIAVKMKELLQDKALKVKKEGEKAEAETQLADATQSYDDTEAQMHADIKFFDETKASCQSTHEEWETRSSLREMELAGVKKALAILTTDAAREMFAKSIKAGKEVGAQDAYDPGTKIDSFLQLDAEAASRSAYAVLRSRAKEAHSIRLAELAVQVREAKVGHFDKVIEAIDLMIKTLHEEQDADIAKRDQCKEEYNNIASTVSDLNWQIEKNLAKIDKLEGLIELRTKEKLQTIEDIAETNQQIKDMEEQRIEENTNFLQAKSDDVAAIELLVAARKALKAYFEKNDIKLGPLQGGVKDLALNQEEPVFEVSEDQAPDVDFAGKGSRKNESKGIVQIMTMLIEDLNDEIKNGMKTEEEQQLAFEKSLKAAQDLKQSLIEKKANLEEVIAKRENQKLEEHDDMKNNKGDLGEQLNYKKEITPDCDWIIGAFEQRAERRTAEQNGLVSAKEFLAGKQALLQAGALRR